MAKKMLVDAGHPEETRVVVVSGNRIEEFDFESAARKQLKGNIYLAKVTRVEPSLQAAFVEYGGNRHGFLAFSEIHPDYYQIPVADRERLLKQEAEESRRLAEEANEAEENETKRGRRGGRRSAKRNGRRKRAESTKAGRTAKAPAQSGASEAADERDKDSAREGERPVWDPSSPLAFLELHLAEAENAETGSGEGHDSADLRNAVPEAGQSEAPVEAGGETAPAPEERPPEEGEALLRSRSHWVLTGEQERSGETPEGDDEDNKRSDEGGGSADGQKRTADDRKEDASVSDTESDSPEQDDSDAAAEGDDAETTTINELTADEEAREELERRPRVRLRDYKIQEVIKRRQIMLVQVVKEERGNKGAALTTYLSLAGRYCVLMPNTPRGGGISRKITNAADRKRLKAIASELDVPEGMGLIIRTAGANRTKAEIRRDYEYLLRLWESVRELTLQSSAPCLVYEEGSLIKRSIRDLYSREIDNVLVEGDEGYKEAKAFMRMLMPSHAKNVQSYKDRIPLFQRYQVEQQLDAMLTPQVQLPSGGYVVLNPTEALVAIDVNSGKSTREHNIEDTALRTNLEAAEEIARQLRLRDLAGLIVIDFIDMEESRNNRAVERKLKECLKLDRARIQTGRISMFGLLEMSRQRLRAGMMEVSTVTCSVCLGTGIVRSVESAALRILRACEEEGLRQRTQDMTVPCAPDVANYLLNFKRHQLTEIEQRYGVNVYIEADPAAGRDSFEIKRGEAMTEGRRQALNEQAVRLESAFGQEAGTAEESARAVPAEEPKPKPRRGGRRRRKDEAEEVQPEAEAAEAKDTDKAAKAASEPAGRRKAAESADGGENRRRRRRGKRGGRRHRKTPRDTEQPAAEAQEAQKAGTAQAEAQFAEIRETGTIAEDVPPAETPPTEVTPAESIPAEAEIAASPAADAGAAISEGEGKIETPESPAAAAQPPEPQAALEDFGNGSDSDTGPGTPDTRSSEKTEETEIDATPPTTEEEEDISTVQAKRPNGNGRQRDEEERESHAVPGEAERTREPEGSGEREGSETATAASPKRPARRGWWQRRSF